MCLFWYWLLRKKNILLVNVRVLWESVALYGIGVGSRFACIDLLTWVWQTQALVLFINKLFSENWGTYRQGLFSMEILLICSKITMQRMFTGSLFLHTNWAGWAGVPRRFTKPCTQSWERFSSRCSTRQTLLKQAHYCGGLQIEWQHENRSDRTVLFSRRTLIQDCLKAHECQVHGS